jgi:hypothetical protein
LVMGLPRVYDFSFKYATADYGSRPGAVQATASGE